MSAPRSSGTMVQGAIDNAATAANARTCTVKMASPLPVEKRVQQLHPSPVLIRHGSDDADGANPISQARSSKRTRRSRQNGRSPKVSLVWKGSNPFLERDRDAAVRAQANLVSFDLGDEAAGDIMTVTGMAPESGIALGQTDPRTVERVDGPDMDAVGADDFHSRLHAFNS
jgi:hypothetical protein